MDEKRVAENILIIGLSTIFCFVLLIWWGWYYGRNFFERTNLIGYLAIFFSSLLIGISIACSVRKKGFKEFLWASGMLFIIFNITIIIANPIARGDFLLFGILAMTIITAIIGSIIVWVINPLIKKFYLKEK